MKKVITGWAPRDKPISQLVKWRGIEIDAQVYRTKGAKQEWQYSEWPPKKIRVTIEEVTK